MPYIDPLDRVALDPHIDALTKALKVGTGGVDLSLQDQAGRFNYAVTRMAINVVGQPKYWKIALMCGVLHNIVTEFYRKLAVPYEDKKIAENGDVYPPG